MKKLFTLSIFFSWLASTAQITYTATGGPIQNIGNETHFTIPISGMTPSQCDSVFGLEEVCLDITHPSLDELNIFLKSPSGRIVQLSGSFSCFGANYTGTCFNNYQSTSIAVGTAPFSGGYKPMGYLGRFNVGEPSNGIWTLIVKDWLPGSGSGTLNSWSLKFSATPHKPVILKSSNLPLVFVNTNNQTISTNTITVTLGIVDNGSARNNFTDARNNYNGQAQFHIRGSSSTIFEKKCFKIDLVDNLGIPLKSSILGMPAESDWDLTAGYPDKTLMRNAISQRVFRDMGHYSPRFKMIELIIDGEYQGVYTFIEKPKRDPNRVDISKLTNIDNYFPDVTGGYIIQIDRADAPGWNSLYPGVSSSSSKFYYKYDYPKDVDITPQQKNYIKAVTDTFETVMSSATFDDPYSGYARYIEVGSFIDFFILNEFSKNIDGYRLSTYLYKDKATKGGKLHIGPAWDYDIAWHNCKAGSPSSPSNWQYNQLNVSEPIPTWWNNFTQDPNFNNAVYCRWHTLRQNKLSDSYLDAFVDSLAGALGESQARNFKQFPIIGAYIYPNPQTQAGASYQGEVNDLKNWIAARAGWMDAAIPGGCNTIGIKEENNPYVIMSAHPNPFSSDLKIEYTIERDASVKIEILNSLGESVFTVFDGLRNEGTYIENSNTYFLSEGAYTLRMNTNGKTRYQKMIKLQNN